MSSILSKIRKSLAIEGVWGTINLCMAKAVRPFLWFIPSFRRKRAIYQESRLEFDHKWGVDTCGTVYPEKSEVFGCNWLYGVRYEGCDSTALDEVLNELPIHYEHFTFVDLGSGKGKAILVASRYPFRKIVGVEYSEQLNEIARNNVSQFPEAEKRCKEIDIVCADAAKFPIPLNQLVIFLYNPFGINVMKEVVKNVSTSFQQNPRRIIVLYYVAKFSDVWRNASFIEEIGASRSISIYDTQGHRWRTRRPA